MKIHEKLLAKCASRSFNEHYDVQPWSNSIVDTILSRVKSKKIQEKLAKAVSKRAIEFRKDYGVWGAKHFHMLEKHAEDMYSELGTASKLTKENFWTVVDICAINALRIGGQRIGDVQIDLYHFTKRKKK